MADDTPLANCTAEEWTFNSLGQSPCEVAAELGGVCTGGPFKLPPLPPNSQYLGPTETTQTSCRCNTVYYSMLSACAHCQQRDYIRWTAYQQNCSTVYIESYPQPIPRGLAVPKWAYLDVQGIDGFDPTAARAIKDEFTGSGYSDPSATPGEGESSKVNIGAVVGGAVGGVVFLILVGLLVFLFIRRRRRLVQATNIDVFGGVGGQGVDHGATSSGTPPPTTTVSQLTGTTIATTSPPRPTYNMKLYNPDDPSTWPHNFEMYPNSGNAATTRTSFTSGSSPSVPRRSTTAFSSDHTEPILPNFTGVSSTTAFTQGARTTFGDSRYQDIEV